MYNVLKTILSWLTGHAIWDKIVAITEQEHITNSDRAVAAFCGVFFLFVAYVAFLIMGPFFEAVSTMNRWSMASISLELMALPLASWMIHSLTYAYMLFKDVVLSKPKNMTASLS